MYFGNESDVMEFCDVPNKVSETIKIYFMKMIILQTCNYTANRAGRTYFENKVENDAIFFHM